MLIQHFLANVQQLFHLNDIELIFFHLEQWGFEFSTVESNNALLDLRLCAIFYNTLSISSFSQTRSPLWYSFRCKPLLFVHICYNFFCPFFVHQASLPWLEYECKEIRETESRAKFLIIDKKEVNGTAGYSFLNSLRVVSQHKQDQSFSCLAKG